MPTATIRPASITTIYGFFKSVDRGDVRVVQRRKDFGFALEALDALRVARKDLRKYLDGYVAIEFGVAGAIDFPHAARPKWREDFVRA